MIKLIAIAALTFSSIAALTFSSIAAHAAPRAKPVVLSIETPGVAEARMLALKLKDLEDRNGFKVKIRDSGVTVVRTRIIPCTTDSDCAAKNPGVEF